MCLRRVLVIVIVKSWDERDARFKYINVREEFTMVARLPQQVFLLLVLVTSTTTRTTYEQEQSDWTTGSSVIPSSTRSVRPTSIEEDYSRSLLAPRSIFGEASKKAGIPLPSLEPKKPANPAFHQESTISDVDSMSYDRKNYKSRDQNVYSNKRVERENVRLEFRLTIPKEMENNEDRIVRVETTNLISDTMFDHQSNWDERNMYFLNLANKESQLSSKDPKYDEAIAGSDERNWAEPRFQQQRSTRDRGADYSFGIGDQDYFRPEFVHTTPETEDPERKMPKNSGETSKEAVNSIPKAKFEQYPNLDHQSGEVSQEDFKLGFSTESKEQPNTKEQTQKRPNLDHQPREISQEDFKLGFSTKSKEQPNTKQRNPNSDHQSGEISQEDFKLGVSTESKEQPNTKQQNANSDHQSEEISQEDFKLGFPTKSKERPNTKQQNGNSDHQSGEISQEDFKLGFSTKSKEQPNTKQQNPKSDHQPREISQEDFKLGFSTKSKEQPNTKQQNANSDHQFGEISQEDFKLGVSTESKEEPNTKQQNANSDHQSGEISQEDFKLGFSTKSKEQPNTKQQNPNSDHQPREISQEDFKLGFPTKSKKQPNTKQQNANSDHQRREIGQEDFKLGFSTESKEQPNTKQQNPNSDHQSGEIGEEDFKLGFPTKSKEQPNTKQRNPNLDHQSGEIGQEDFKLGVSTKSKEQPNTKQRNPNSDHQSGEISQEDFKLGVSTESKEQPNTKQQNANSDHQSGEISQEDFKLGFPTKSKEQPNTKQQNSNLDHQPREISQEDFKLGVSTKSKKEPNTKQQNPNSDHQSGEIGQEDFKLGVSTKSKEQPNTKQRNPNSDHQSEEISQEDFKLGFPTKSKKQPNTKQQNANSDHQSGEISQEDFKLGFPTKSKEQPNTKQQNPNLDHQPRKMSQEDFKLGFSTKSKEQPNTKQQNADSDHQSGEISQEDFKLGFPTKSKEQPNTKQQNPNLDHQPREISQEDFKLGFSTKSKEQPNSKQQNPNSDHQPRKISQEDFNLGSPTKSKEQPNTKQQNPNSDHQPREISQKDFKLRFPTKSTTKQQPPRNPTSVIPITKFGHQSHLASVIPSKSSPMSSQDSASSHVLKTTLPQSPYHRKATLGTVSSITVTPSVNRLDHGTPNSNVEQDSAKFSTDSSVPLNLVIAAVAKMDVEGYPIVPKLDWMENGQTNIGSITTLNVLDVNFPNPENEELESLQDLPSNRIMTRSISEKRHKMVPMKKSKSYETPQIGAGSTLAEEEELEVSSWSLDVPPPYSLYLPNDHKSLDDDVDEIDSTAGKYDSRLIDWLTPEPEEELSSTSLPATSTGFPKRYMREATENEACERFRDGDPEKREFYSPEYPRNYTRNIDCVKVLEAEKGMLLKLDFRDHFELEHVNAGDCKYDYLEVRDGQYGFSTLIGKFCGKTFPPEIISKTRYLWLRFHSDDTIEYQGFKAVWSTVPRPNTTSILEEIEPCIHYIHNLTADVIINTDKIKDEKKRAEQHGVPLDCLWVMNALPEMKMQLSFETFKLDKPNDCGANFLDIFGANTDEPSRLKKFCGSIAETVTTKTNTLYVRLYLELKAINSSFQSIVTAYRERTSTDKPCKSGEYDCEDATCIAMSLRCNRRHNCRFQRDEDPDQCGDPSDKFDSSRVVIILVIFSLIMFGMFSAFIFNCVRKLRRDHRIIREHIRQSRENRLDEIGRRATPCPVSVSRTDLRDRGSESPSVEVDSSKELIPATTLIAHEYTKELVLEMKYGTKDINDIHQSNNVSNATQERLQESSEEPEMCDSSCQTRESLFDPKIPDSVLPSPEFSTFGYRSVSGSQNGIAPSHRAGSQQSHQYRQHPHQTSRMGSQQSQGSHQTTSPQSRHPTSERCSTCVGPPSREGSLPICPKHNPIPAPPGWSLHDPSYPQIIPATPINTDAPEYLTYQRYQSPKPERDPISGTICYQQAPPLHHHHPSPAGFVRQNTVGSGERYGSFIYGSERASSNTASNTTTGSNNTNGSQQSSKYGKTDPRYRAEAVIEVDQKRPFSIESTKSAPDVIATH